MKQNDTNTPNSTKEKVAEMVANPEITTDKEIYESQDIDISKATFYRWKKEQEFIDMVNEKIEKFTDSALADAWHSLIDEVNNGNVGAIRLFFKLKNKYKEKMEVSGPEGGAIEKDIDLTKLSDEELDYLDDITKKIAN